MRIFEGQATSHCHDIRAYKTEQHVETAWSVGSRQEVEQEDDEARQDVWEGLVESYNPDEVSKEGQEGEDLFDDYQNESLSQEMVAGKDEEQGREPKTLKSPTKVTKAEREKHEATHAPYQPWCKYCVKAKE